MTSSSSTASSTPLTVIAWGWIQFCVVKVRLATDTPGPELRGKVQDAADYCPNQVIRIIES